MLSNTKLTNFRLLNNPHYIIHVYDYGCTDCWTENQCSLYKMIYTKFSFSDGNEIQIFLNEQVVLHADTIKCIIYRGTFILQGHSLTLLIGRKKL